MKFFEKVHTYEYDWETATAAWWDKYPNTDQPHVRHWDTLKKELNGSQLKVNRLFWIEYGLPKWVHTFFRTNSMDGYGVENVVCDVSKKSLVMRGRNYTFRNLIEIEETCTYKEHPENPQWTQFIHRSEFKVGKLGLLNSKLETSARDSAMSKSKIGVDVMEGLIAKLHLDKMSETLSEMGHKGHEQLDKMSRISHEQIDKINEIGHDMYNRVIGDKDDKKK